MKIEEKIELSNILFIDNTNSFIMNNAINSSIIIYGKYMNKILDK